MGNKIGLSTKRYADRYIEENYNELAGKFRALDDKISEKGVSSLDKLNDTILSLYEKGDSYKTYKQFKAWADKKFTPKEKR